MSTVIDRLKTLYSKDSYFKKYGKDAIIAIIIVYIFITIICYYHLLNHVQNIKQEWPKYRCQPMYMPFAGIIMKTRDKTNTSLIHENFAFCIQNMLESIINTIIEPILFSIQILMLAIDESFNIYNLNRNMFNNTRDRIIAIINDIYKRILNVNIFIMQQIKLMKVEFNITEAILTSTLYQIITYFMAYQVLTRNILKIYNKLKLIPLAAAFYSMAWFPQFAISIKISYDILKDRLSRVQAVLVEVAKIRKIHIKSL